MVAMLVLELSHDAVQLSDGRGKLLAAIPLRHPKSLLDHRHLLYRIEQLTDALARVAEVKEEHVDLHTVAAHMPALLHDSWLRTLVPRL